MPKIISVARCEDILPSYRGTPVGLLLEYHNLGRVADAGWERPRAERHFAESVPKFGIRDEVEFVLQEAARLRSIYPRIQVAPLLYRVDDDLLYQLSE